MWGPMGVDQRLRSVSSELPAVFAVAGTALKALTCLSMKLLGIGYRGDDEIC